MRISAHKRREWLGGRHRAGRLSSHRVLEPEVLAQAALWIRTIAGGAWSPAVAATGRTVGGLSEGRAGKQRDQRESSKKRFHHTSPELTDGCPWFLQ